MDVAAAVLRTEHPQFEPPSSVRSTGCTPWACETGRDGLARTVAERAADTARAEGRLAVIAPRDLHAELAPSLPGVMAGAEPDLACPVVLLDPREAKGLEFGTAIVVEPSRYATSDLYVALTRATQSLGIVHTGQLPMGLEPAE